MQIIGIVQREGQQEERDELDQWIEKVQKIDHGWQSVIAEDGRTLFVQTDDEWIIDGERKRND